MFELHVTHINVHQGSSRKKVVAFSRNNSNLFIRIFTNMSGGRYTRYSISNDYNVIHRLLMVDGISVENKGKNLICYGRLFDT